MIPTLGERIRALEARLEDPALFTRDRAGFDAIMADLEGARAQLSVSEEEWLTLEEKKETLGA